MTVAGLIDSIIFNSSKRLKGETEGISGPSGKMVSSPHSSDRSLLIATRHADVTLTGCLFSFLRIWWMRISAHDLYFLCKIITITYCQHSLFLGPCDAMLRPSLLCSCLDFQVARHAPGARLGIGNEGLEYSEVDQVGKW